MRRSSRCITDETIRSTRLGDCLPPDHLARFVVDTIAQIDLSALCARYGSRGGQPYAPEILLAVLFYGYATGVFSSRKLERATYETVPFRFIAGDLHPDHDTLATFRKTFLPELKDLFVQVLLLAQVAGVLKLGDISLDGTKIHADAGIRKAVSYKHLLALEAHLRPKNSIWLALDGAVPVGFMRFEGYDFDGVAIVEADDAVCITGAYVRPAYRGRHLASALLDAALRDYQAHGLTFCAVNFESFNPEATAFWMQYFDPVCLSFVRVPEVLETGQMRM